MDSVPPVITLDGANPFNLSVENPLLLWIQELLLAMMWTVL